MKQIIAVAVLALILFNLSCTGPTGPAGPPGSGLESLSDPRIQPKVVYSNPPANSTGPYADFENNQIQIRFNKIMDRSSVRRAITLSSPETKAYIDTYYVRSTYGDIFTMSPSDSQRLYYQSFKWKLG